MDVLSIREEILNTSLNPNDGQSTHCVEHGVTCSHQKHTPSLETILHGVTACLLHVFTCIMVPQPQQRLLRRAAIYQGMDSSDG